MHPRTHRGLPEIGLVVGAPVLLAVVELLTLWNPRELEGVIAHELSHIGNHDIRLTTTLAGLVSVASLPFTALWQAFNLAKGFGVVVVLGVVLAGQGGAAKTGARGAEAENRIIHPAAGSQDRPRARLATSFNGREGSG